jgi:hypothetical protein
MPPAQRTNSIATSHRIAGQTRAEVAFTGMAGHAGRLLERLAQAR